MFCRIIQLQQQQKQESSSTDNKTEEIDDGEAREERKATGRSIAIGIFIALMFLALYHVIQKKTTILAGVSFFFLLHMSNGIPKIYNSNFTFIDTRILWKSRLNISINPPTMPNNPTGSCARRHSLLVLILRDSRLAER